MIKVFIVNDHEIIRKGLKQILLGVKDVVVVGEQVMEYNFFKRLNISILMLF